MKIYFAASIRGGRSDSDVYAKFIEHLRSYGEVLTEHVGDKGLSVLGEDGKSDQHIHDRDLEWVLSSDVVVAEVSTPSLGVGYEIGRAIEHKKKVLCLHRPQEGKRLSAMIAGCPQVITEEYQTFDQAREIMNRFFRASQLLEK